MPRDGAFEECLGRSGGVQYDPEGKTLVASEFDAAHLLHPFG